ncbi:MAG: exodeoxyribonuclease VII large subunit [Lachnospiraceae bacterium]|nr:exodeoxyribonuclease VII large subunit [Lachnospiraceae bacterium]
MQKVYSVGQINTYIRNMFTQDFVLNRVSVRGEISNLKYHTSGHIYFTLKDASAAIACVMFAGARGGLAFRMSNGQQVIVDGAVNVYERDGKYQLYATKIRQDGAGELYEKFLELKEELEEMGMFAPEYKQPIPKFVRRLGVVTAPTGAAIRDIINIATRRNPGIRIILYPAKVQGEGAAESVAAGLAALDALGVDVIIVGRGGGSIEDLWAFNEETVARAIFSCHTPVISAVGHETDTTIADFVADLRAPTPSAAAELAVADVTAWLQALDEDALQLQRIMQRMIKDARSRLRECELRMRYAKPQQRLMQQKQRLDEYEERLRRAMQSLLEQIRHQLALSEERLRRLSPYEKLESGYGCILTEDGRRIRSVSQVAPGEVVQIYLADGRMTARIQEVKESKVDSGKK